MCPQKIRVGFIGTGRVSVLHQLFHKQDAGVQLVAVCDKNKKSALEKATQWGLSREDVYTDLPSMLKRSDIDAVEVLTPHSTHKRIVVAAYEAGKHICVQKVPCLTLREFDYMQNATHKAGVKLKIYENFQFHPPYRNALDLIETGDLGKAMAVNMCMWNTVRALSDWGVQLKSLIWRITERNNYKLPYLFDDGYHKHNLSRDVWVGET